MSAFSPFDRASEQASVPISGRRLGRVAERYALIHSCLTRYLSGIMVDSCIKQALSRRGMSNPRSMRDLESLVEEVMVGLRLFVPNERLPDLMIELTELLQEDSRP
jgi:hypothetical protein